MSGVIPNQLPILFSWACHHHRSPALRTWSWFQRRPLLGKSYNLDHVEPIFQPQRRYFLAVSGKSCGDATANENLKWIRLSRRMSELDICSRREADRLIMDGRVLFDGRVVEIGGKVLWNATVDQIEIRSTTIFCNKINPIGTAVAEVAAVADGVVMKRSVDSVVLNKPLGFVSGQAEHGNTPAIRLLTRGNLWMGYSKSSMGVNAADLTGFNVPQSWAGFAPAGRLDMDSTGLLVFTKHGVLAKKIISSESTIEKEYIVDVMPASQETRRELALDPAFRLPTTTMDLTPLLRGGHYLLEATKRRQSPLKPCQHAQWIVRGEKLRVVLTEGRKHQVRRMCRELVGWHVTKLHRVRIGPVAIEELPIGLWRPLRQGELDGFLNS